MRKIPISKFPGEEKSKTTKVIEHVQQTSQLAFTNQTAAARQLETVDTRKFRFQGNMNEIVASREQEQQAKVSNILIGFGMLFLKIRKKITSLRPK